MRAFLTHLVCFVVAAGACLALVDQSQVKSSSAQGHRGLQLWGVLRSVEDLDRERRRREELEVFSSALKARMQAKQALARDLGAGKLTLLEAGARLRDLMDAAAPETWNWLRQAETGESDPEKLCRHIIDWTKIVLPDGMEERVAQLEAELEEHRCNGTLVLTPR